MAKLKSPRHPINFLKNIWHYNPETGWFTWKIHTFGGGRSIYRGDRAGTLALNAGKRSRPGYKRRQIGFAGKIYKEHILAYAFMIGEWPPEGSEMDHIDGDGSNNKWSNLRLATRSENLYNRNETLRNNTSGVTGVALHRDRRHSVVRWQAYIDVNGKRLPLGKFYSKEEAITARLAAEQKYCGEFAPNRRA
jgi:hypothetical protein